MTRAKILLIAAGCAATVATASPARALNPQPLPPGRTAPTHVFCASGNHMHRWSAGALSNKRGVRTGRRVFVCAI